MLEAPGKTPARTPEHCLTRYVAEALDPQPGPDRRLPSIKSKRVGLMVEIQPVQVLGGDLERLGNRFRAGGARTNFRELPQYVADCVQGYAP
jgi:hypothetical protein